jgi:hypothetical protein
MISELKQAYPSSSFGQQSPSIRPSSSSFDMFFPNCIKHLFSFAHPYKSTPCKYNNHEDTNRRAQLLITRSPKWRQDHSAGPKRTYHHPCLSSLRWHCLRKLPHVPLDQQSPRKPLPPRAEESVSRILHQHSSRSGSTILKPALNIDQNEVSPAAGRKT